MIAARAYGALVRHRLLVIVAVVTAVLASGAYATGIGIDMSFRPTFSTDSELVDAAAAHRRQFGEIGLRELVTIVDVGDLHEPSRVRALAELSDELAAIEHVGDVRDPTAVPMFARDGALVVRSLRGADGELLAGDALGPRVDDMLASRQLRRLVISDDLRRVAVSAALDLPADDFHGRRDVVDEFGRVSAAWSDRTGMPTAVTGYPYVEQVYAEEITTSVLLVIAVLYAVMIAVLYAYFRRWRDTLVTLSGVTAAVPIVLGEMRLLGQPFSIVNSQVLTLVVIVGVAHALHHVEEYRRRCERGFEPAAANRTAFGALAFPSLMTGLATAVGFLALRTAGMPAVKSFGLCTAVGVTTVYVLNWIVVPILVGWVDRRGAPAVRPTIAARWTQRLLQAIASVVDRRPWRVVGVFVAVLFALAAIGIPRVSINQRVNEELPAGHEALTTQQLYEDQFTGFLGPELWLRPATGDVLGSPAELTRFVDDVCALPDVRYVASPLDLVAQPALTAPGEDPCPRVTGPVAAVRPLADDVPAELAPFVRTLVGSSSGTDATLVVRLRDIGTANTLPFVEEVERLAARDLGGAITVEPVGEWWLAQNGVNRLSLDVGFAAVSALAVILPLIAIALRDRRLFLAAIAPTVMPVVAALAFMGVAGIPLRIGTAMILAISLGLAADDTVYLALQIKRRIAAGSAPASALHATLRRTGRPAFYSSIVLIAGFASMTASSLVALRDMGIVAAFTMAYALATDLVLGPAVFVGLVRSRIRRSSDMTTESITAPATVGELLARTVRLHPERPAMRTKRADGSWESLTWLEVGAVVVAGAQWFAADERLRRVSIVAAPSPAHTVAELAALVAGCSVNPVYHDASDGEIGRVLGLVRPSTVISTRPTAVDRDLDELFASWMSVANQQAREAGISGFETAAVVGALADLDRRADRHPTPSVLLQSTGTTAPAKIIDVPVPALLAATWAVRDAVDHRHPRFAAILPSGHISHQLINVFAATLLAGEVCYGGGVETIVEDLRAVRPTVLFGSPLLFDEVLGEVRGQLEGSRIGRALGRRLAADVARIERDGRIRQGDVSLAGRIIGRKAKKVLGLDRATELFSGTSPLDARNHALLGALGWYVRNTYGVSECGGAATISDRSSMVPGELGAPVEGMNVDVDDAGEIWLSGASMMRGYVGQPRLAGSPLPTGDMVEPHGGTLRFVRRRSSVVSVAGVDVDLDAVERTVRANVPGSTAVAVPIAGGLDLYVFGALNDVEHIARVLGCMQVASRVTVVPALLDGSHGEIGPTGKVRRWRVAEVWGSGGELPATRLVA